ncbi:probable LRR receptor-like serine/threonine-protein kinase At3g47570 [Salvia miltiorrhiza]|uniref:probable LRR receptor-like serine/threonine-protein kinase At3g47570 n=1 Tax=Salvia miltiorrhiza TaxID=226208 RepID=UPI0025AD6997|nr:probable LRR receptor-like serine/threonine-protein kinase At3g47570 [Salvia miltiorrhiza]
MVITKSKRTARTKHTNDEFMKDMKRAMMESMLEGILNKRKKMDVVDNAEQETSEDSSDGSGSSVEVVKKIRHEKCKEGMVNYKEWVVRPYRITINVIQGDCNARVTLFDQAAEGETTSTYYRGLSTQAYTEIRFMMMLKSIKFDQRGNLNIVANAIQKTQPMESINVGDIEEEPTQEEEKKHSPEKSKKINPSRKKKLQWRILPHEIGHFQNLVTFDAGHNEIAGSIDFNIFMNMSALQTIYLGHNKFAGNLLRDVGNITMLTELYLQENHFTGLIPAEFGQLYHLSTLLLRRNSLSGSIPHELFNISTLRILGLVENALSGVLPTHLCHGSPSLERLYLGNNSISGAIPNSISNCSQLIYLSLSDNKFSGYIPTHLGNLRQLQSLQLFSNNLTQAPSSSFITSLTNCKSLTRLEIDDNPLNGVIPASIGNLSSSLQTFSAGNCKFSGSIPVEIDNLSNLMRLALQGNELSESNAFQVAATNLNPRFAAVAEPEPDVEEIASMPAGTKRSNYYPPETVLICHLYCEHTHDSVVGVDQKGAKFWGSLCTEYNANRPQGSISRDVTQIKSHFQRVSKDAKRFEAMHKKCHDQWKSGMSDIQILEQAEAMWLAEYRVPFRYPHAWKILRESKKFASLGEDVHSDVHSDKRSKRSDGLPTTTSSDASISTRPQGQKAAKRDKRKGKKKAEETSEDNQKALGNLYLNSNMLNSSIPSSLWGLTDLITLDLSSNSLNGSLPLEMSNLGAAIYINVSMNQLSKSIPSTIGKLQNLIYLPLVNNRLEGSIPVSMGSMISLENLDLSYNNLSSSIPKSLEALQHLDYFNVSFNSLSGEIPNGGSFRNFTMDSFKGNEALCGIPKFHVQICSSISNHRSKRKKVERASFIIFGVVAFISVVYLAFIIVRNKRKDKTTREVDELIFIVSERISYYELLRATKRFDESNLLGTGSSCFVYKGILNNGMNIVVKVFNMQLEGISRIFDVECEILRSIRHRNLTSVISSCSNEEFKALVLEYMRKGNLEKWLYSHNYCLNMMERLNIMIDVASALEYLHHGYSIPIVHSDLKPSNVLLDEDMVAHVSDFGIAKLLCDGDSFVLTNTLATLGYIAPEYGLEGQVSTRCDVYSYGVMLIETFTRKMPSDDMLCGDMSLKRWVELSLSENPDEVIDANLVMNLEEEMIDKNMQCVSSILELALKCSADSPGDRINMKQAHAELQKIKHRFSQRDSSKLF